MSFVAPFYVFPVISFTFIIFFFLSVSFSPLRPFTFHIPCLSSFQIGVMVRMLIGFLNFCKLMEENTFFGPSTFKTTIALSSAIFLLLLTSHYEAPYGSPQRLYVVELTGTVLFDLIDVVSIWVDG